MNTLEIQKVGEIDARITATGVFEGLSCEQLAEMESMGVYMEYYQEPVLSDGHDIGYFFYILRGVFEVSKVDPKTDKKHVLTSLGLGQCFGEMSFLSGAPASANVMAIGRVICWAMPHDALRKFIESHSGGSRLALNIAGHLARRVLDGNTRLMGISSSLSAYFGRKARMDESHSMHAPQSNDLAEMEIPDEVMDGFVRETLELSPSDPVSDEQRDQVRAQIENNEADIIPWLEKGALGKNLKVRLKFVEETESPRVAISSTATPVRTVAQPRVVRVPQVRARMAPVKSYVKQSENSFWRYANVVIYTLLPIVTFYVIVLIMPFEARESLAASKDFQEIPYQGLLHKILFQTRSVKNDAMLQKDASYSIEMSMNKVSRFTGIAELTSSSSAPMPIKIRITSKPSTPKPVYEATAILPVNQKLVELFSVKLQPGVYQLEVACENWPDQFDLPAKLQTSVRY
jgi:CRP-like cAMP-binding protein